MSQPNVKRAEIVHNLDLLKMLVNRASVEWVVIHTNPKCERRAHDGLIAKGILSYLPIECVVKTYGPNTKKKPGGTYTTKRPLFARYLFAGIDTSKGQSVDDVRSCDGVKGLVSVEENGRPVRVCKGDLARVIEIAHGTFEGEPIPDSFIAQIANLPEGSKLALVKGCWKGLDYAYSGYDEVKKRVHGEIEGKHGKIRMSVAVDDVEIPAVSKKKDDS